MDWNQIQADFKQKYEGCWCNVLIEGYSTPRIFLLEHVEKTKEAPLLHLRNKEFGEIILKYDDSKSDVSFKFPSIGLYNYKNQVVMVRRKHERQWKKGICSSTLDINCIYSTIHSIFEIDILSFNEELLQCLDRPTEIISLKEGMHALDKILVTCLSPEFALGLSTKSGDKSHLLWYYENPIGTVDPVSKRIYLYEDQFKQEFEDFVTKIRGADEFSIYC